MHTTVLGSCDVCTKPDREVSFVVVCGIETWACDECFEETPIRRPRDDQQERAS